MAADGPRGVYTEEQIKRFYPLLKHDYDHGQKYDDPLRKALVNAIRSEMGDYRNFSEQVSKFYKSTTCPSLEQLINDFAPKEAGIVYATNEPEASSAAKEPKAKKDKKGKRWGFR